LNSNSKWFFRVSSLPEVGGGHIMRCLSLSRVMARYVPVHFLLCPGGEYWISKIEQYGITASVYKSSNDIKSSNLLVDGYEFSDADLDSWKNQCGKLVMICDYDTCSSYADIVIAPNLNVHQISFLHQILLSGYEYALLAPEYSHKKVKRTASSVKNILISFGLYDSNNFSARALNALNANNFSGNATIAIGRNAPYLSVLYRIINNFSFSVEIILDSNGLYQLLLNTDMVIGSGGMSLLERMSLGIPSVTVFVTENQKEQVRWSEQLGATIALDGGSDYFDEELIDIIGKMLLCENTREEMMSCGMKSVDGLGAERVAEFLLN